MITTNVLIIGQSGVGKSSLLNYLFDADLEQTGVGKPITKRGIYPHSCKVGADFTVVIHDTWGLEAEHAAEWERLILDEVEKHDSAKIADWFHTVFFCVSAARARIEDFELNIAKRLREGGSHVLGIITNAGNIGADQTVEMMRRTLIDGGFEPDEVIPVSSVEKKSFAGCIKRFGRERLLNGIREHLWKTICEKLPAALKSEAFWHLDQTERALLNLTNRYFRVWNYNLKSRYEQFGKICSTWLSGCCAQIGEVWRTSLTDAAAYYRELMAAYHIRVQVYLPDVSSTVQFAFRLTVTQQMKNFLEVNLLGNFVPCGPMIFGVMRARRCREAVRMQLQRSFTEARNELEQKALGCSMIRMD